MSVFQTLSSFHAHNNLLETILISHLYLRKRGFTGTHSIGHVLNKWKSRNQSSDLTPQISFYKHHDTLFLKFYHLSIQRNDLFYIYLRPKCLRGGKGGVKRHLNIKYIIYLGNNNNSKRNSQYPMMQVKKTTLTLKSPKENIQKHFNSFKRLK